MTIGRQARALTICFAGPMLGGHRDWVPSPAQAMAVRLRQQGYRCLLTSSLENRYLRAIDMVRTVTRERARIDVVALQVYGGPSFVTEDLISRLARRLGHGLVMVLRGGALPAFVRRHPAWALGVLKRAQVLVAPSDYLAHALRAWGLPMRVIPNVLYLEQYPYRHRVRAQPRLLWMRTFHEVYHPQLAVEVAARVRRQHPQVRLTMAGQDKGLLAETRCLAERHGLATAVRFAGFLDPAGKRREFDAHDIFLNTNRIDNMPVSVLEAAAFGLPVVATAVGGVPYLLTRESTGLLVPDDDAPGMARAVLRLLGEPRLVNRLSTGGRRLAETCGWERVGPRWERAFQDAGRTR